MLDKSNWRVLSLLGFLLATPALAGDLAREERPALVAMQSEAAPRTSAAPASRVSDRAPAAGAEAASTARDARCDGTCCRATVAASPSPLDFLAP